MSGAGGGLLAAAAGSGVIAPAARSKRDRGVPRPSPAHAQPQRAPLPEPVPMVILADSGDASVHRITTAPGRALLSSLCTLCAPQTFSQASTSATEIASSSAQAPIVAGQRPNGWAG